MTVAITHRPSRLPFLGFKCFISLMVVIILLPETEFHDIVSGFKSSKQKVNYEKFYKERYLHKVGKCFES